VAYETYQALLDEAATLLPLNCVVVFLADRGFADTALMAHATRLGWHWRIRIKGCFVVYRRGQHRLKLSNYELNQARRTSGTMCSAPMRTTARCISPLTTLDEYGLRFDIEIVFPLLFAHCQRVAGKWYGPEASSGCQTLT
jgi:hypothetical protein